MPPFPYPVPHHLRVVKQTRKEMKITEEEKVEKGYAPFLLPNEQNEIYFAERTEQGHLDMRAKWAKPNDFNDLFE